MSNRFSSRHVIGGSTRLVALLAASSVVAFSVAATGGDPHSPPAKQAKPATPSSGSATGGHSTGQTPAKSGKTATEGKHDAKSDSKPDQKAETKPELKPDSKPESKPEGKASTPKANDPAHGDPASQHTTTETPSADHGDAAHGKAASSTKTPAPAATGHAAAHATPDGLSADASLRRLVEGNARFSHNLDNQTQRDIARRGELAAGQHPFAIILSCADSRVPPELIFDQDLGDLFVVRVAGNTADEATLGSIEYAVDHLGSKLIVVMGHTKCGAVKAAVDTDAAGKGANDLPGHLPAVVDNIMPAVIETKDAAGDRLKLAIMRNVQRTVQALRACGPSISEAVNSKGVRVVGALYDLETGEVDFLPELSPSSAEPSTQTAGATESKHE